MLSYLHGYHAGNHADILKHTVLTACLALLCGKPTPVRYVDTHAGAGGYDLKRGRAQKNREYETGIVKTWSAPDAPKAVRRLVDLVKRYNLHGELDRYPGSPWLARQSLRDGDQVYLFELHPSEHAVLADSCRGDRRVKVTRADGLNHCIGLVPPPSRRSIVLIDPPYETDDESPRVLLAVEKMMRKFETGVIAIWYPVIDDVSHRRFERKLHAIAGERAVTFELIVAPPSTDTHLRGSAMFVINPPWKLAEEMREALPWLARRLGGSGHGNWRCTSRLL